MKRRTLIAGGLLLPLAYCGYRIRPSSFRVKMTVAVDTPEGLKTGASVFEIGASDNIIKLPFNVISTSFKGEAVAVDLGGGQTLFALLRTPKDNSDPMTMILRLLASPESRSAESWLPSIRELSEAQALGRKAAIPRDDYPMLVRFKDKNDPKSVEVVDSNDLKKSFGEGISIKSMGFEITKTDVTNNIVSKIPSFEGKTGFDAWYKNLPYGDPRKISLYEFKQGF